MKNELPILPPLEAEIQGLNILDDGCVLLARVLEVHRPFDRLEILILNASAAHLQRRRRIGPSDAPFSALVIEFARTTLHLPPRQQFIRRLAGVSKGKERLIKILAALKINVENLMTGEPGDSQAENHKNGCDREREIS